MPLQVCLMAPASGASIWGTAAALGSPGQPWAWILCGSQKWHHEDAECRETVCPLVKSLENTPGLWV